MDITTAATDLAKSLITACAQDASGRTARIERLVVRAAIAAAGLAVAFAALAEQRILYRSVLPDGRVVYGDAPAANARRTEQIVVEPHPPNPQETEAALRALALTRAQLLRDAAARKARLGQLDNQVAETYDELREAESRREAGREVGEGDRQGRRLADAYFVRQRAVEGAVQQARLRLDRLLRERAALRY